MIKSKPSIVNRKGMITIPADLREKLDLHEGTRVTVMELEGNLVIIPIVDIEKLRTHAYEEFAKVEDEARAEELEIEK
jgi:AbrB family looped-hinge helix DNA binding protein